MSKSRTSNTIHLYYSKNKKFARFLKIFLSVFGILVLFVVLFYNSSSFLNIILSSKDFNIKNGSISFKPEIESSDTVLNIKNDKVIMEIIAKKMSPIKNGEVFDVKDIIVNATLVKTKKKFNLKSKSAIAAISDKIFTFNENVSIIDQDSNTAKFEIFELNSKTNKAKGTNPALFGVKGVNEYNLFAKQMNFDMNKKDIFFNGDVNLEVVNTLKNENIKAVSNILKIDYYSKICTMKDNVVITYMTYTLKSDEIKAYLKKDREILKNKKENFSVEKIVATGNVVLLDKDIKVESDMATYYQGTKDIVFTENVKVTQLEKTLNAKKFIYNTETKKGNISSDSKIRVKSGANLNRVEFIMQ